MNIISVTRNSVAVWVPGLSQTGGIQSFLNFVVRALSGELQNKNIYVVSKHDTESYRIGRPNGADNFDTREYLCGNIPAVFRTIAFSAMLFWTSAIHRPKLIVVGLTHFAIIAKIVKLLFRIPYVVFAYGIEVGDHAPSCSRLGLAGADLILAISQHTKDRVLRLKLCNSERIQIFPCCYDASRFHYLDAEKKAEMFARHSIKQTGEIILSVGRLCKSEKYKGHEIVLRALTKLIPSNPRLLYIIAGDGDYRKDLEKKVNRMGLSGRVIFVGEVPNEDMADYYHMCDLFVMPSKGEGFGIVYLEAMACGKPVIAGNQDGSTDALKNGELGILVNPDSADEVALAIRAVIDRTYPLPILYQPAVLSQKVKEYFGFEAFSIRLNETFKPWLGEF